ncbi:CULlin protein 1 [Achlya hypogyna]|uniref:CULlin protein 1 n=1 Tax=Achlya hypogyna TaxID=1202772 RepID=A0A1V9ZGP3_ACHHY|nr:CULlin protein 1 [Achlya hypogyna]
MASKPLIELEQGWKEQIKPKGIDILLNILDKGFDKVQVCPFPPQQYMPIYTICYDMCTQRTPYNWSAQLYTRHGETFTEYLRSSVLPELQNQHDEFLLNELHRRWQNHKLMNKWMAKFFMYLDRYYVKHNALPTLAEAGLNAFKTVVFQSIKKDVVDAMLELVEKEREGEIVDTTLLRNCIEVFETMGMGSLDVYITDFEEPFIKRSTAYYATKAQTWLEGDSTPAYMIKTEDCLKSESSRVARYMHSTTEAKLLRALEIELLEKHQKHLLERENSGCIALLQNDKAEDLSRMFRLFSRVPEGLAPIATLVRRHIETVGNEIVERRTAAIASDNIKDPASDPTFIKDILALHDKYKQVVQEQFGGNSLFQKALKEAFVEFVNKDVGKDCSAKLMSTFCDRILKSGGEKLSDDQVEDFLQKIVSVFSYLTDKDLFAEIYRNQLAKRLLNQRSSSDDAEISMISKLKMCCGAQFTSKMEGMLNDLAIGGDHQAEFDAFLKKNPPAGTAIEFGVQVLTTGHWPSYTPLDLSLPPQMVRYMSLFKMYYDSKTSHRRLQWVHSLGNATVRATFPKNKWYDLQVTTLQAVALLLFNAGDAATFTFEHIKESLNLSEDVVKRILHSLSCGKYKLVTKTPMSKNIATTDTFALNLSFVSPMRKVRVPMASLEESHNPKHVEEDRSIAIEAAIVRIMKARKTLQHQQLISEVLSQLAFFRPNPKLIKRRIEALIDREYLERDPDSTTTYRYLA